MAENKTQATEASVSDYIASRAKEEQKADCKFLMALFKKVTKQRPRMWGPSIVGYGSHRYVTAGGRSGDMPLAAFAIRGKELCVYLDCAAPAQSARLARLGKHRMGKCCLYLKRLADVDKSVLEALVVASLPKAKRAAPARPQAAKR